MAETPSGDTGGAGGLASGEAHLPTDAVVSRGRTSTTGPTGASGRAGGSVPGGVPVTAGTNPVGDGLTSRTSDEAPRGAGGTSAGGDADDEGTATPERKRHGAAKVAGAAAAVPAAGAAGQLMLLAMFLKWLKGLGMMLLALAMNLWNLAVAFGLGLLKAATGAVMAVGTAVSAAVGGAVSAAAAGVTTFVAGGAVVVIAVVGTIAGVASGENIAVKDGSVNQCLATAQTALDKVDGSDGSVDERTLANAKTIFSVLSAWGMPDENIAGIIGNWDAESGIDPTSVQGYFNSPQAMSDEKKAAAGNTDNGIGLGQWTFGRNSSLRTYSTGHGQDWWTLNAQLGFMLSAAEGANADVVKDMMTTSYGTPGDAALHFHDAWERSADTAAMKARRAEKAGKWMALFSGWDKDQALADSILAQAGTTVDGANTSRAETVRADCRSVGTANVMAKEGGLTLDEAQDLIDLYKQEGEGFLRSRYGAGGPGDCGYGKADNCVGFDTYFMNKYTSFQKYAMGNGIDQAGSIARETGKTLTKTPTVYSVASGPGTGAAGHVMVILGIQGDQAIIGEAACGTNHRGTRAYTRSLESITDGAWEFVDVSDLITDAPAGA